MTTTQKDSVIQCLEEYVARNPDSHIGSYMLYANPSGSGLKLDDQRTLAPLYNRIQALNQTGVYEYEGIAKPLTSVSIQTRVRHTITELVQLFEIVGFMRTWKLVHDAKRLVWPPVPPEIPGVVQVKSRYPPVKYALIRSLKSAIIKELTGNLPTLIDEVYRAKYKSSGTFSYSLAETKLYTMKTKFLSASLSWIDSVLKLSSKVRQTSPDGRSIEVYQDNGNIAPDALIPFQAGVDAEGRPVAVITRESILWEDWYSYSFNKTRDTEKFAPYYEKLCSAVCARYGKLRYATVGTEDYNGNQLAACQQLAVELGFDLSKVADVKKKVFQIRLYEFFMIKVQETYQTSMSYGVEDTPAKRAFIVQSINVVINTIRKYTGAIGIEDALVYLDVFSLNQQYYTKANFRTIVEAFSQTGVCNERVVNAITKFISDVSLLETDSPRKKMAPEIEMAVVTEADFDKIKVTSVTSPNIIFSPLALSMMPDNIRSRFDFLRDEKTPGAVGYVQKGVMSLTAALKVSGDMYNLPSVRGPQGGVVSATEYDIKFLANQLDEIATMFRATITPILNARKKSINDQAKTRKLHEQWGIIPKGAGGVSPNMQLSSGTAYIPASMSPQTQATNSMFPPAQAAVGYNQAPLPGIVATAPHVDPSVAHSIASHQVHPHVVHNVPPPVTVTGAVPEQLGVEAVRPRSRAPSIHEVPAAPVQGLFGAPGSVRAAPGSQGRATPTAQVQQGVQGGLFGAPGSQGRGTTPRGTQQGVQGGLFGQSASPNQGGATLFGQPTGTASPTQRGPGLFGSGGNGSPSTGGL